MIDIDKYRNIDKLESQLFFPIIECLQFRNELTIRVKKAKGKRVKSQAYLSNILNISLTKIKQIEKGTCKDVNAINNYINFFGENMVFL